MFSGTFTLAGDVNTGLLSLTGVTVTEMVCMLVIAPSLACTMTTYTLSALASVGASKSGGEINASAPAGVMANFD